MECIISNIFGGFPVIFLELLEVKDINNLSCTCKLLLIDIEVIYEGILNRHIHSDLYFKDPFGREFNKDVTNLGISGLKCLPYLNTSVQRYCKAKGFSHNLIEIPDHLIICIDSSGSTGANCCNIENGHYQGSKTVLDVIKMFSSSIIEVLKSDKSLNISKISIISFESVTTCHLNNAKINEIDLAILDKITTSGGTDFNRMINFVTNNLCKSKCVNHKLLVLTDCCCQVDKNSIQVLMKKNCNINTCFVPPGSIETLELIRSNCMNSGIHEKLSTDFTKENTVDTWCNFIGDVISSKQNSILEVTNYDSTKSIYNTTDIIDDYIEKSIRPIYKIKDVYSKQNLVCYDYSGKHFHKISSRVSKKSLSHEIYSICIKKMFNDLNTEFNAVESKIDEYKRFKQNGVSLERSLESNKIELKSLNNDLYYAERIDEITLSSIKIIKWFKHMKFARHLREIVKARTIKLYFYAYKIQRMLRERLFSFDTFLPQNNYGLNYQRKPFDFGSYGMIKIENFFDKNNINSNIIFVLKCLKDIYSNIDRNNLEIDKFNKKKELNKLKSILRTSNEILKSIISGIEGNLNIKIKDLDLPIDSIIFTEGKLKIQSDYIKIYVPIENTEYVFYKDIFEISKSFSKKVSKLIDNFENMVSNTYQMSSFSLINPNNYNIIKQESRLFRDQSSTVGRPMLSRQVSNSIKSCNMVGALRSVSCK